MRRLSRGGAPVPPDVIARAGVARGEKVLASCRAEDGTWLLGTRDALLILPTVVEPPPVVEPVETGPVVEPPPVVEPVETGPAVEPPPVVEPVETRIAWQEVASADWSRDDDRLRVVEVGEFGRPQPVHEFSLGESGSLLPFLRERVTASMVLQRRVEVRDRLGLSVIARRPPSGRGEITWAYELDPGLDPADPEVRRLAESGLRAAAEELGLA